MKVTIDLPDHLLAEARDCAEDEGLTLDEIIGYCVDITMEARAEAFAELELESTPTERLH